MRRDILTRTAAIASVTALLALAACGGGGGSPEMGGSMPPDDGQPETGDPMLPDDGQPETGDPMLPDDGQGPVVSDPIPDLFLPLARPAGSQQVPVIRFGDELRVGTMPPPEPSELTSVANHDGAAVRYGRVRDGLGTAQLSDYLGADSALTRGNLLRFAEAPVVRFVAGTTAGQIDQIVRAVQLLNDNLPRDFQLTIDATPVSAADDAAGNSHDTLAEDQILVEFDRREDWEIRYHGNAVGNTNSWDISGRIITARVWVDDTRLRSTADQMETLVHELVHALGRQHADSARFPSTIMHVSAVGTEGYFMHQLDREALLAVYSVLEPGDTSAEIVTDLGPWEDESLHVRGDLGDYAFGASLRNGLVRPWALGPRPGNDLADNAELAGSASWSGRLLGLTPSGGSVAGAAGLTVDLTSLSGDLDFTSLESWAGAPGAAGTGAMWGDGDLNYDITVQGNVFARTGGDEGHITGAFFGASHAGMGGTLVRDDLGAGFAGTR